MNIMMSNLLKDERYSGKFVAIKNGEIIDIGNDKIELILKMMSRFLNEVVLVTQVKNISNDSKKESGIMNFKC